MAINCEYFIKQKIESYYTNFINLNIQYSFILVIEINNL